MEHSGVFGPRGGGAMNRSSSPACSISNGSPHMMFMSRSGRIGWFTISALDDIDNVMRRLA